VIHQKTIYQKTRRGIAEIAAAEKTLNFRQRQALILVDGKRSAAEIGVYLNQANMPEILANLENLGHIVNTANPPPPNQIIQTQSALAHSEDVLIAQNVMTEQQVNAVKAILISSAELHLGIMGRRLQQKIEEAVTDDQITACTSQWHMAMRESKLGREVAGDLMNQIQQLLMHTNV